MKIRPVGSQVFRLDGQLDRHYVANSRFLQFFERA
jgi:hypothetical protein